MALFLCDLDKEQQERRGKHKNQQELLIFMFPSPFLLGASATRAIADCSVLFRDLAK
jgi:hypothetical protein